MKKHFTLVFILVAKLCFSQSTIILPNQQQANSRTGLYELKNGGILIQHPDSVSTLNPNLNVITMINASNINANAVAGTVSDPGGNGIYLPNVSFSATYTYNFASSLFDGVSGLKIWFEEMDIPDIGDSLNFYEDDNLIYTFSGITSIPEPIWIGGFNTIQIKFKTNNNTNVGQGFRLKYASIYPLPIQQKDISKGGSTFQFNTKKSSLISGVVTKNAINKLGSASINSGFFNFSEGLHSSTFGYRNYSFGNQSMTFGSENRNFGPNSFSGGYNNTNMAVNGGVLGQHLVNRSFNSLTIGRYNDSTVVSPSNAHAQLYPENPIFVVGNGTTENERKNAFVVRNNGNTNINGFTSLGLNAPKIQMTEITGITANAQGGSSTGAHGLTGSKILKLEIFVEVNGQFIPPHYKHNPTLEYDYYFDATNIYILNSATNSSGILDKPLKILIIYKE